MEWQTSTTLLDRLRCGDDLAWCDLVARLRPLIVGFARRLGADAHAAEEVAQESLASFVEALQQGRYRRDRGRLSAWLFGIVLNQIRRARRGAACRQIRDERGETTFWSRLPDERCARPLWEAQWQRAMLSICLEQVRAEFEPETFRAFELAMEEDRSAAHVGRALGIPVKAVYNAKHRVLRRIRELLGTLESCDERSATNADSEPDLSHPGS